ncbi:MAG: radical SAM family heme chaperone HemW [Clostridiales bacterium]|nr:radical SAM family heme chaperone HemW [Clostridiales bacterium]
MLGKRNSPTPRKRHQKPVTNLKTVRQHQKREEKRIKELERSLRDRTLGVYIHIPFCKSKCAYCDFYSLPGHESRMDAYAIALAANLSELAPSMASYTVDTVYLGGGTPSIFGEQRLKNLLNLLNKTLHLAKNCEFTMECNPDSVTPSLVRTVRKAGVNRISLGMQSAQDEELLAVGRPHTMEQTRRAVQAIRKGKIKNLSLDLIYGLPGQTMESWQSSVEEALSLGPEHLSLYALTLEEGTSLWAARERTPMADDDELAERYLWAVKRLGAAGYEQYEISNFAKPGYASRHNQKYWRGEEYVGFGPAAHSDFGGCRYSYIADLEGYIDGMASGKELVAESEQIPEKERAREYLMLRLRTTEGIQEEEYHNLFRMSFVPLQSKLEEYAAQGWAVCENGRWRFTPEGFLRSNPLIGGILEAQEADMVKNSAVNLRGTPPADG